MIRLRPTARFTGGPPPRGPGLNEGPPNGVRRRRHLSLLGLLGAIGLCAVAAFTGLVPGLAFGAESNTPSTDPRNAPPTTISEPVQSTDGNPSMAPSVGSVLVTLPWGSGEGEVGLERPVEGLTRGPEALAIAPSGRIAVLDSVNRRLLFLDTGGRPVGVAAVPLAEPRFLALDDERLYVLDCDAARQLVTLDWNGTVLGATTLPELTDVVTGLFATSEGACVEVAHASVFLITTPDQGVVAADVQDGAAAGQVASARASLRPLAGRPLDHGLGRVAKVTFKPGQNPRITSFKLQGKNLNATQMGDVSPQLGSGRALEHLVSVDSDGDDGLIIGARLLSAEAPGGGGAALLLTRLSSLAGGTTTSGRPGSKTKATGTLLLADSAFAYLGQPYVVAPDGRVFQPIGGESGYSILVYTFGAANGSAAAQEVLP